MDTRGEQSHDATYIAWSTIGRIARWVVQKWVDLGRRFHIVRPKRQYSRQRKDLLLEGYARI